MPVIAEEFVSKFSVDRTDVDKAVPEINAKLASVGSGVRAIGIDNFVNNAKQALDNVSSSARLAFDQAASSASVSFGSISQSAQSALGNAGGAVSAVSAPLSVMKTEIEANKAVMGDLGLAAALNKQELTTLGQAMNVLADQGRKESAEFNALAERQAALTAETAKLTGAKSVLGAESAVLQNAVRAEAASLASLVDGARLSSLSVGELSSRKAELLPKLTAVESALKAEASATTVNQEKLAGLVQAQSLLKTELGSVNKALTTNIASQGANTAAMNVAGQAVNKSNGFWASLKESLGQTTNQITSQGTAWAGFDRIATSVFQGLAAPMGGLTVGMGLLITIGGTLIAKLFKLGEEKQKHIQIDREMAIASALFTSQMAQNASSVSQFGTALGGQFSAITQNAAGLGNLTLALNTIADSQKQVDKATKELDSSFHILTTTGHTTQTVMDRAGLTHQVLSKTSEDLRNDISGLTTTINDQNKAMEPAIQLVNLLKNVTGATSDEVLEFAKQNRFLAEADLPAVRQALENNLNVLGQFATHLAQATTRVIDMRQAAISLQLAMVNIKAPSFDITGTAKGIENAFETAKAAMITARAQGLSFDDMVATNKKSLQDVISNITEYAKIHAKGATAAELDASATSIFNEKITSLNRGLLGINDGSTDAALGIKKLSEASKIQVTQLDRHNQSLDSMKGQLVGIGPAFDVVLSRLNSGQSAFAGLGDAVKKGMGAANRQLEQEAKTVTDTVNAYLQATGVGAKLSEAQIENMSKAQAVSLLNSARAWQENTNKVRESAVAQIGIHNDLLKSLAGLHAPTATLFDKAQLDKDFSAFLAVTQKMKEQLAGGLDISDSVSGVASASKAIIEHWSVMAAKSGQNAEWLRQRVLESFAKLRVDAPNEVRQIAKEIEKEFTEGLARASNAIQSANIVAPNLDALFKAQFDKVIFNVADAAHKLETTVAGSMQFREALLNVAQAGEGIVSFWQKTGAELGLTTQQVNNNITQSFAEAGAKINSDSALALRLYLERYQKTMGAIQSVVDETQKALPKGISLFDASKIEGDAARVAEAMQKVKKSIIGSQEYSAAVASVRSATDAMEKDWIEMAASIGLSTADARQKFNALLAVITKNMPSGAKAGVAGTLSEMDKLKQGISDKLRDIKSAIDNNKDLLNVRFQLDSRAAIDSAISDFERLGVQLNKSGQELQDWVEVQVRKAYGDNVTVTKAGLDAAIESHRRAAIQLPGVWNEVFSKVSSKFKGWAGDIFGILETIPGKFGDTGRKILSTVDSWLTFANQVLAILHRLSSDIPGTLGELTTKVIGIFKKTQSAVVDISTMTQDEIQKAAKTASQSFEGIAGTVDATGKSVQGSAKNVVGGLAQIAGAVLAFAGSKGAGFVQGAFSGALGGIAAAGGIASALGLALSPLTLGLSALGGGLLGGLLGLFSGKSDAQKQAEKQAADRAKVDMQQAAQNVFNSAIEGFMKALEFFDKLDQFTAVRRKKFEKLFGQLKLMMDEFVKLARVWGTESLDKAKALAEAMGPVVAVISAAPAALNAIDGHFGIAQASIDRFFLDFGLVIVAFGVLAESTKNKLEKEIKLFGRRIGEAIGLISGVADGMKSLTDMKPVDASSFDVWKLSLNIIVAKLGELAEEFGKKIPKAIAFFAERIGPGVELWKSSIDALKSMVDIPVPSQADFANLFASIKNAIDGMVGLAGELSTEGLTKAQAIAQASLSIFAAIKAAVESLGGLRDYKSIASETFTALWDDFNKALNLMSLLKGGVDAFESIAKYITDHITMAGDYLKTAILNFASGLNAAASAINGAITLQGGIETGSFGASAVGASSFAPSFAGSSFGASSFTPSSFTPSFAGAQGQGGGTTVIEHHYHYHGTVIEESRANSWFVRQLTSVTKQGRN
jgi:hypothetical protein